MICKTEKNLINMEGKEFNFRRLASQCEIESHGYSSNDAKCISEHGVVISASHRASIKERYTNTKQLSSKNKRLIYKASLQTERNGIWRGYDRCLQDEG